MNLHEYQAKQLFARYGLPAPVGYACTTPREAEEAASKIGVEPVGSEMSGSRWWPR